MNKRKSTPLIEVIDSSDENAEEVVSESSIPASKDSFSSDSNYDNMLNCVLELLSSIIELQASLDSSDRKLLNEMTQPLMTICSFLSSKSSELFSFASRVLMLVMSCSLSENGSQELQMDRSWPSIQDLISTTVREHCSDNALASDKSYSIFLVMSEIKVSYLLALKIFDILHSTLLCCYILG